MKLFPKKDKKELSEIQKAKEKIKKEKEIIKQEKKKIKKYRLNRIHNSKIYKFIKKHFILDSNNKESNIKREILSTLYFELLGAFFCLLILFILSGGKNYFKLYYELNKLIDTYDTMTNNYYGKINKDKMINNAISSMVASVDDNFTSYSNIEGAEEFTENVGGTYEGIGATVATDKENNIFFVEIFDNSPAKKAGLKPKDIVKKIDGKTLEKKSSNDVAEYVKSSKKDKIIFTILRDNKEKEITIKRGKINIPTISSKVINKENHKIGYISISLFTSVTTNQFKDNIEKLEKNNIDALIIDVRDNNGGYLTTATDISKLFLKKGKIIYQLKDKNKIIKEKDDTKEHRTYKIAVLVNKASASASEILASAIKDSYGGYVVGTKTYGKGTVQKAKKLQDGTMLKYTIEKWLTPKGEWINEKGVTPTHHIEITDNKNDLQLEKAIEILKGDLEK